MDSYNLLETVLERLDEEFGFQHWKLSLDVDKWYRLRADLADSITDALRDAYDEGQRDATAYS